MDNRRGDPKGYLKGSSPSEYLDWLQSLPENESGQNVYDPEADRAGGRGFPFFRRLLKDRYAADTEAGGLPSSDGRTGNYPGQDVTTAVRGDSRNFDPGSFSPTSLVKGAKTGDEGVGKFGSRDWRDARPMDLGDLRGDPSSNMTYDGGYDDPGFGSGKHFSQRPGMRAQWLKDRGGSPAGDMSRYFRQNPDASNADTGGFTTDLTKSDEYESGPFAGPRITDPGQMPRFPGGFTPAPRLPSLRQTDQLAGPGTEHVKRSEDDSIDAFDDPEYDAWLRARWAQEYPGEPYPESSISPSDTPLSAYDALPYRNDPDGPDLFDADRRRAMRDAYLDDRYSAEVGYSRDSSPSPRGSHEYDREGGTHPGVMSEGFWTPEQIAHMQELSRSGDYTPDQIDAILHDAYPRTAMNNLETQFRRFGTTANPDFDPYKWNPDVDH